MTTLRQKISAGVKSDGTKASCRADGGESKRIGAEARRNISTRVSGMRIAELVDCTESNSDRSAENRDSSRDSSHSRLASFDFEFVEFHTLSSESNATRISSGALSSFPAKSSTSFSIVFSSSRRNRSKTAGVAGFCLDSQRISAARLKKSCDFSSGSSLRANNRLQSAVSPLPKDAGDKNGDSGDSAQGCALGSSTLTTSRVLLGRRCSERTTCHLPDGRGEFWA